MTLEKKSKRLEYSQETVELIGEEHRDRDREETLEWIDAIKSVIYTQGKDRALFLLKKILDAVEIGGLTVPFTTTTPYINSIDRDDEPPYPGNRAMERRIKSIIRWNAMAMVVQGNRSLGGIGGHISTYASAATLLEVAFNHFFKGPKENQPGDQVYFQGHASPGIYARAFLEGRITEEHLHNFRRELAEGGGLPSYPHPRLMPGFWQFPTVSMGIGPMMAIYQARFNRYLQNRGIANTGDSKVWAFVGDGETDEPEALAALHLAAREKLDNLIFVVNCNLQRLDGPVRGNGKIIQELEGRFRGAGWNVIKVIWGTDWDPLFERDKTGNLVKKMNETVDGEYQKFTVAGGDYIRQKFFTDGLGRLVEHMTDEQLWKLRRGGHDPQKVYAAYYQAVNTRGKPTVILAKTIKGYGMGEAGEGKNITHQQKKLNEEELLKFRTRFSIPLSDEQVPQLPFYKPAEDSAEIHYLKKRREALGGYLPQRSEKAPPLSIPEEKFFQEFFQGSGDREVSTTMGYVRLLSRLLANKELGKHIVPIIPDEARTFGMESLFRQYGIYAPAGQLYEPVDRETLLYYKEAQDGQIIEEGINEAGAISSFVAAGTSYSTFGVSMIPFYIFYSMFGFQRIGDSVWAAGDMKARGFLLGATAGRTTLNGEGLQHQDGHSHVLASTFPNLLSYDPAYVYEMATILEDGMRRMYVDQEDLLYYLTVYNENYRQPPRPEGSKEGILKGLYKVREPGTKAKATAHLLSSGPILREALAAAELLEEKFKVSTHVWSATSFGRLRKDALEVDRWNRLHPTEKPRESHVEKVLKKEEGAFVAATDYMASVADQIGRWVPGGLTSLGTDGFGRSEARPVLRRFFEVDAPHIALAALYCLSQRGEIKASVVEKALGELDIDPEKPCGLGG